MQNRVMYSDAELTVDSENALKHEPTRNIEGVMAN